MSYYGLFELGSNVLEQFVSSEPHLLKNNYNWNVYVLRPKDNIVDKSTYEKNFIKFIINIHTNRFDTFKEYVYLNCANYKRFCYENVFLSDNNIDLSNTYSRWKYPTNNVLFINSNVVQVLASADIIFREDDNERETDYKIMLLDKSFTLQKNNIDYLCWEHGCKTLSKQLVSITNEHKYIFVNNCYAGHWQFLFGYLNDDGETNRTDIQVYICNSSSVSCRDNINKDSTTLTKDALRLLTLVRLMKLYLFVSKYKNLGNKNIIISTHDNIVFFKKELQKEMTIIYDDKVKYLNITQQHDFYSCGQHVMNHFHSMLHLIHKNTASKITNTNAINFEEQITNLKSFKYFPTEYIQIRSDMLEFLVNFKYVTSILHNDMDLFCYKVVDDVTVGIKIEDIMSYYDQIAVANKTSTHVANKDLAESINGEIISFVDQFKNELEASACQCCLYFPKNKLKLLQRDSEEDDWPDIHQFSDTLVEELKWQCRRTGNVSQKGAFYFKSMPTASRFVLGKASIKGLLNILGSKNPGYKHDGQNYSNKILDTFFARLSFNCMFKTAQIPDGGSCCEWIATALIMNEDMQGEYFSYLNGLRKGMKFERFSFAKKPQEINRKLRMWYAFSLTYGYNPSIEEFMNNEYRDDLNHSYCRTVIGYMHNLCNLHQSFSNGIFLECCRNFISLTPSQVGKYGCMWGQSDFLLWFQCVFNIRLFMINKQTFGNQISITSGFECGHFFGNSAEYKTKVNYENDGIFDFEDKSKLIPYGIMIGFIDGAHFDKLFIPYDQQSPLIPVGSDSVLHITPYLKISKELWSSLTVDNVKQHNKEVIDQKKIDRNKELNYWYDCHFADIKIKKSNVSVLPPIVETRTTSDTNYSVPSCAIKLDAIYIALLCYLFASKKQKIYTEYIHQLSAYKIEISELDGDMELLLKQLEDQNEKIYKKNIKFPNPFRHDNLTSDHGNDTSSTKLKIYEQHLRNNKLINPTQRKILTAYSPFSERKNYFDEKKTKHLVEKYSPLIPKHLQKKFSSSISSKNSKIETTENTLQRQQSENEQNDEFIYENISKTSNISSPSSLSASIVSSVSNKSSNNFSMKFTSSNTDMSDTPKLPSSLINSSQKNTNKADEKNKNQLKNPIINNSHKNKNTKLERDVQLPTESTGTNINNTTSPTNHSINPFTSNTKNEPNEHLSNNSQSSSSNPSNESTAIDNSQSQIDVILPSDEKLAEQKKDIENPNQSQNVSLAQKNITLFDTNDSDERKDLQNPIQTRNLPPKSPIEKPIDRPSNESTANDVSELRTDVKLPTDQKQKEKTQDIGKVNQFENLPPAIDMDKPKESPRTLMTKSDKIDRPSNESTANDNSELQTDVKLPNDQK